MRHGVILFTSFTGLKKSTGNSQNKNKFGFPLEPCGFHGPEECMHRGEIREGGSLDAVRIFISVPAYYTLYRGEYGSSEFWAHPHLSVFTCDPISVSPASRYRCGRGFLSKILHREHMQKGVKTLVFDGRKKLFSIPESGLDPRSLEEISAVIMEKRCRQSKRIPIFIWNRRIVTYKRLAYAECQKHNSPPLSPLPLLCSKRQHGTVPRPTFFLRIDVAGPRKKSRVQSTIPSSHCRKRIRVGTLAMDDCDVDPWKEGVADGAFSNVPHVA
ncbi:hypothetical protein F5I97DRAFT_1302361 [Phlebopus sp. FC_14]|nr:hypothetical protein F5I97DRAFT_1302361 [Phlebopus sp. FC_14]